jgi:hypothetical protein
LVNCAPDTNILLCSSNDSLDIKERWFSLQTEKPMSSFNPETEPNPDQKPTFLHKNRPNPKRCQKVNLAELFRLGKLRNTKKQYTFYIISRVWIDLICDFAKSDFKLFVIWFLKSLLESYSKSPLIISDWRVKKPFKMNAFCQGKCSFWTF